MCISVSQLVRNIGIVVFASIAVFAGIAAFTGIAAFADIAAFLVAFEVRMALLVDNHISLYLCFGLLD